MIDMFYQEPGFSPKEINEAIAICKLTAPNLAMDIVKHNMMYHGAFALPRIARWRWPLGASCPTWWARRWRQHHAHHHQREFVGDMSVAYKS